MTETNKEVTLEQVPYIYYSLSFRKDTIDIRALIDLGSKVNAIVLAYASKLGLKVCPIDVGAQKVDAPIFEILGMVLASFLVEDKLGRARFFQKTFLLANISVEIVLGMPFFTLNNADIQVVEKELT